MADSIVERMQPPKISNIIPACYLKGTVVKITVPFSMNRGINLASATGFELKIKTIQSNQILKVLSCENIDYYEALNTSQAVFFWENFSNALDPGEFVKVQMAYSRGTGDSKIIGYYSNVGILKFTSKPSVQIMNLTSANLNAYQLLQTFYGKYSNSDLAERVYKYIFNIYNMNRELVETSDWQLHDSVTDIAQDHIVLTSSESVDTYSILHNLEFNRTYYIQYGVSTVNNLIEYSPLYSIEKVTTGAVQFEGVSLVAENQMDNGYVQITLDIPNDYTPNNSTKESFSGAFTLVRSSEFDDYNEWQIIKQFYLQGTDDARIWKIEDFTIEQGIKYQYGFQKVANSGLATYPLKSNKVFADFEDMFLYDGKKQLKLRFNPKVSSFKTTLLEQKVNTIGNQYPFIFRNGKVNYKEFPISGLITYLEDENNRFLSYEEDLRLFLTDELSRPGAPSADTLEDMVENSTGLTGLNIRAERLFKLKVLDWLNNGEIKLFKSPTEGNYLVRLMDVSLSPVDQLGRMLHTMSAQACEIATYDFQNLVKYNLIQIEDSFETNIHRETILIDNLSWGADETEKVLNNYPIYEYMSLSGAGGAVFYQNNESHSLGSNGALIVVSENQTLPNVVIKKDNLNQWLGGTFTYQYFLTYNKPINFDKIQNIVLAKHVNTFTSNDLNYINSTSVLKNSATHQLIKFYVLNFSKKSTEQLIKRNNQYYKASDESVAINYFDKRVLYEVNSRLYTVDNSNNLQELTNQQLNQLYSIELTNDDEVTLETIEAPITTFEPNLINYTHITFGAGIVLDCAYEDQTITLRG